ncbi:hypothetical protein [Limisphaera sp. VF-2]|uniref:hypothetical protein n=1 Tax=Limisphaera sp. VF-2 TaxID=3400418 RepID=UPI0017D58816
MTSHRLRLVIYWLALLLPTFITGFDMFVGRMGYDWKLPGSLLYTGILASLTVCWCTSLTMQCSWGRRLLFALMAVPLLVLEVLLLGVLVLFVYGPLLD